MIGLAASKKENKASTSRKQRPAMTPEARENQLIAMAYDAAEEKFRDGTASNQLICFWLQRGTTKERLEKEMMIEQKKLLQAKTEAYEDQKDIKELYVRALNAMKTYSGNGGDEEDEDEYDD